MVTPNNLPAELTSFIGREGELRQLKGLLSSSRLITLTGAGGSGKTRLALKLAFGLLSDYPHGVWLVELAPVLDEGLLAPAVASVLDVREGSGRSLVQSLCAHLHEKQALLVLDSCEHLVEACARLTEGLLMACRNLSILVTSQEPLNVPGEVIWRVPSLSVPRTDGRAERAGLLESEAIRLFVDRARLVQPGFDLSSHNGPTMAQICRRLDGMPLAIELAAARMRLMPGEEILRRLEDRFRLLTGGRRTAIARQQTLRATVDWSYEHLSEPEQALFRRLSVFAGGFSLEAAEAVCAGGPVSATDVLSLLTRLVDRSMVDAHEGLTGTGRYRLLETLRQYGQERLRDSRDEGFPRRHAEFFLLLAEEGAPQLFGAGQSAWLARLEQDHDNIRAAMAWAVANEPDMALHLAVAMGRFWYTRGYLTEGREWLTVTIAASPPISSTMAQALAHAGWVAWYEGDYEVSRSHAQQSLAVARQLDDRPAIAAALNLLGGVAHLADGDFETARRCYQESLDIRRELGDRWGVASSLNNVALALYDAGDYETAHTLLLESLKGMDGAQDRRGRANTLDSLARVRFEQGAYEAARAYHGECLRLSQEAGDKLNMADAINGFARLAVIDAQPERALTLAGAARAIRDRIGSSEWPGPWQHRLQRSLDAAHKALPTERASSAWATGMALTEQDAVALALGEYRVEHPAGRVDGGGPLTPRENEISVLIAQGLSNREIAERLVISERTVDAHVEHIRNKLGLRSRAQIAAWATREAVAAAGR